MNVRLSKYLFCAAIWLVAGSSVLVAEIPKELQEAEAKYIENATERLSKASDEVDARTKLATLNKSFLQHLEKLRPRIMALSEAGSADVEVRIRLMSERLDSSLPLELLDARSSLRKISVTANPPANPEMPAALGSSPTGELTSREEGKRIKVGETFDMNGKTRSIPKGFAIAVFGGKASSGLFPREYRKDPNRQFVVRGQAGEAWLGPVEHVLMMVPEAVMAEIEFWYIGRRKWEETGFAAGKAPVFRGQPTSNLYRDDFIKAGAKILAEIKMEYVR